MNGVGGDLFALVWHAETERLYALNATGRAPHAISRETLVRQGYQRMPGDGPAHLDRPRRRRRLAGAARPLRHAAAGRRARPGPSPTPAAASPVSEIIAGQWNAAAPALAEWPDSATTYLPGGRAPLPGDVFRNPRLAATYEAVAEGRPRRVLPRRHRPPHRGVQRRQRRLLHAGRLRGPHVRLGRARSPRATAATTSGRCRPTAPASSR